MRTLPATARRWASVFARFLPTRVLTVLATCLAVALPASGTSVLPMYLDEIVDAAAVAFQGTVVGNRTARDENGFVVTYTTFQVQDAIKGSPGSVYTIKQIGGELPGENIVQDTIGVPRFSPGESVVVFLYGVSKAGFSSPVGLEQGRFFISDDAAGPQVTNGRDFRDMAKRLVSVAPAEVKASLVADRPMKQMPLDDFKSMVRSHANTSIR